jgi:hypothetical protein
MGGRFNVHAPVRASDGRVVSIARRGEIQQGHAPSGPVARVMIEVDLAELGLVGLDDYTLGQFAQVAAQAINRAAGELLAEGRVRIGGEGGAITRAADVPAVQEYFARREEMGEAYRAAQLRAEQARLRSSDAFRRAILGLGAPASSMNSYPEERSVLATAKAMGLLVDGAAVEKLPVSNTPPTAAEHNLHPDHPLLAEIIQGRVEAAYAAGRKMNVIEIGRREVEILGGAHAMVFEVGEERTVIELQLRAIDADRALSLLYDPEL